MNPLIQEAIRLRQEGKSYQEIADIQGCSKSTASWRCNPHQRVRSTERNRQFKKDHPIANRVWQYQSRGRNAAKTKVRGFQRRDGSHKGNQRTHDFTLKDVTDKFGPSPICYLTGRQLDWEETHTYWLDHIVPATRGGDNSLENMGIAHKQANQAKADMTLDEFIILCQEILEHNGYIVTKKSNSE